MIEAAFLAHFSPFSNVSNSISTQIPVLTTIYPFLTFSNLFFTFVVQTEIVWVETRDIHDRNIWFNAKHGPARVNFEASCSEFTSTLFICDNASLQILHNCVCLCVFF